MSTEPRAVRRILFVAPPALTHLEQMDINPLPPMGLGYLAAVAEGLGKEAAILDCLGLGWERRVPAGEGLVRIGLAEEEIERRVREFAPDLVGVSCQFSRQHRMFRDMMRLVRRVAPEAVIVAGGAHATVRPEDVLANQECSYALLGEAEDSLAALLGCLERGRGLGSVDGLAWREDGRVRVSEKTGWVEDLDRLPLPAYHLMNLEHYFGIKESHGLRRTERYMPVITSRGCPSKCTFCSAKRVWGNAFRARSVDSVIAEMRLLRDEYGVQEIMFEDDNVTADPKRAKALFRAMIEADLGFLWDTPNGVGMWSVDTEMLDLMKESGCVNVNFPVESGSQRVLKEVIRKPIVLKRIRRLIAHCREIGLDYGMFLVIGMPGETLEEIRESFRFAASCGCYHPHVSVATPYPGSDLYDICVEEELFSRPYSFDDLFIRSFLIRTPQWGEEELREVLAWGYRHLRIKELLRSPGQLAALVGGLLVNPARLVRAVRLVLGLRVAR